jgi:hypothetical protein
MRRAALLALCLAVLGGSASGVEVPTGGARTAANPLVAIHFEFKLDEFATHYTVVNTLDPAGLLDLADASYRWTLKPPDNDTGCNNHGVLSGEDKEFVWRHGNVGEPGHDDGCHHDVGLPSNGHPGKVSVQVADRRWFCTVEYTGTQAADASAVGEGTPGSCTAQPSSQPPPPPPPPKCKCLLLTARVVPSSLRLEIGHHESSGKKYPTADRIFTFTVHWVLNCSKGSGGCNGHLSVKEPARGKLDIHWYRPNAKEPLKQYDIVPIECAGRCGEAQDGGMKLRLWGRPSRGGEYSELARDWENARFKFLIKRTCQGRKLKSVPIWIALDETGKKIDFKRSKLG